MHIAVNALLVYGEFSGVQHAIVQQLRALLHLGTPHHFSVIALNDVPMETYLGATPTPYTVLRAPLRGGERLRRMLWEQTALPSILAAQRVDLLYAPGYLTSLRWHGPAVVFIHDTIALAHPQWCKTTNALNYRLLLPPSARHASRVAVPSHASARDVARYCQVPAARIDVVPLGVTPPVMPAREAMEQHRQQFGMHDPFLLAVSTIEPKKNFANLIRWFDVWKDAGLPQHLVIAGHWGWKTGDVRRALASSRYQSQIHLLGYVHQPLLPCLMAAADLLLMPSRYEGFGLPALEAMAVGTPVVVSDQGALPETVGPAGLVLPLDDARWQQEIPALLHDPQRLSALRDAGQHRAASMTWERTAERLLASFMRAAQ